MLCESPSFVYLLKVFESEDISVLVIAGVPPTGDCVEGFVKEKYLPGGHGTGTGSQVFLNMASLYAGCVIIVVRVDLGRVFGMVGKEIGCIAHVVL